MQPDVETRARLGEPAFSGQTTEGKVNPSLHLSSMRAGGAARRRRSAGDGLAQPLFVMLGEFPRRRYLAIRLALIVLQRAGFASGSLRMRQIRLIAQ